MCSNNFRSQLIPIALLFSLISLSAVSSQAESANDCPSCYIVKPGDTLTSIAREHNMSISELAEISAIKNRDLIKTGKKIYIASDNSSSNVSSQQINKGDGDSSITADEVKPRVGISISPYVSYSRIDATDVSNGAKGGVLSNANVGGEFRFLQLWPNTVTSEIIAQVEDRSFRTNSGRSFAQKSSPMLSLGVGIGYRPFKRLELKGRAFYGDELYFRAPDPASFAIDSTKTLKGDLALYFDIISSKYASTGIGGGGRFIKPSYVDADDGACYYTNFGYGYFGSFYIRHNFKRAAIEGTFIYESITKDSSIFKQTQSSMYLKGSVMFLF